MCKKKEELDYLCMVDLLCDEELLPYYEKQRLRRAIGAFIRNYNKQNGAQSSKKNLHSILNNE